MGRLNRDLHPIAARGFAGSVDAYRRSRPSYPPDAVAWLIDGLGLAAGRTVVDVGAGTGKFTELLVASGARVIAVEPLEQMRVALAASLPEVQVLAGAAEALPIDDASADGVAAAQAFHWFDRRQALAEFARVLRPHGRLGVIWNDLDTAVAWVAEFNAIISPPRQVTPLPSTAAEGDLGPLFGTRHMARFAHVHAHDRPSLLARVESMSFISVLPHAEREEVFARVRALAATHPQLAGRETFEMPYVTHAFWAELIG